MLDIEEALAVPFGYIYTKAFVSKKMLDIDEQISGQLLKDLIIKPVKKIE